MAADDMLALIFSFMSVAITVLIYGPKKITDVPKGMYASISGLLFRIICGEA